MRASFRLIRFQIIPFLFIHYYHYCYCWCDWWWWVVSEWWMVMLSIWRWIKNNSRLVNLFASNTQTHAHTYSKRNLIDESKKRPTIHCLSFFLPFKEISENESAKKRQQQQKNAPIRNKSVSAITCNQFNKRILDAICDANHNHRWAHQRFASILLYMQSAHTAHCYLYMADNVHCSITHTNK